VVGHWPPCAKPRLSRSGHRRKSHDKPAKLTPTAKKAKQVKKTLRNGEPLLQ
jgi:hypothetical protein